MAGANGPTYSDFNTAPFRVYNDGSVVASNVDLAGGTISGQLYFNGGSITVQNNSAGTIINSNEIIMRDQYGTNST